MMELASSIGLVARLGNPYRGKFMIDDNGNFGDMTSDRNSLRKNPLKAWLRTARANAKRDEKEFSIQLSDLPPIPKFCPVLGCPLRLGGPKYDDFAPSLDRVDNLLGYVPGNVIIISRRANRLKGDATPEELRKLADFYGSNSKKPK